jgi:hypothetical protein
MSEIINDSNDEVLAVEETVEAPAEIKEEAVVEITEEAAPVVEAPKAEKPKKEKVAKADSEVVAIFAERNISWSGVGTLKAGYNIVSKEDADKWLSGSLKIRLATPEEVAAKVAK